MFWKYLAIAGSGLLIHLIGIVFGQIQSPCPDVFQYVRDEKTGDIEGLVTMNYVPTGVPLHTTVELSVTVVLPTKYIGSLEFADSKETTIQAIHLGRPLIYRVRFPVKQPLPVVTRISLNDQERCSGSRAVGQISTSIRLDHTFYPPGVVPQLQGSSPLYQRPKPASGSIEQAWITSNLVPAQTPNSIPVGYWSSPSQEGTTSASAPSESSSSVIPQSLMSIADDGLRRETVNEMKSPCPNVFRYVRDRDTGAIEGYIEISGVPIDAALHIKIGLSVAASLPSKYVGRLELALPKDLMIEAIRQGRPLTYRVHFPLQRPLPLITRVLLNNEEHCSGERATGRVSTSITLEHNLFSSGVAMPAQNPPMQDSNAGLYPRPTSHSQPSPTLPSQTQSRPTPPSHTKPSPTLPSHTTPTSASSSTESPIAAQSTVPVQNLNLPPEIPATIAPMSNQSSLTPLKPVDLPPRELEDLDVCGRPRTMNINLLVSRGNRVKPGDWPWMVGIFVSRIDLEFQCGGSLVSDKHVLTAAHCLINTDGTELPPNALLVAVGRYRLRAWSEKGSMTTEVSEYHLHAEYRRIKGKKDNDIAIVTLMETVTFGKLIMPICLWSGPPQIDNVVGKTGFVAGWGRDEDENPTTQEPRMVKVPIVSQEECLRSNKDFVDYTSNRTFCGGARNGSGPCNGDSGGGLVIYDPEERRYYLRGVVSLSLLDRTAGACDLSNFVVYTDAAKYTDWIRQRIAA